MEFSKTIRIAIDAMGGDNAPMPEIEGAIQAVISSNSIEVVLVGDESVIKKYLSQCNFKSDRISIAHASQTITMEDAPTAALKTKQDSSLSVGIRLHKEGNVDAFVSAGNTGAVLSAATLILGRINKVSRPTIGTFIPAEKGQCFLLDAGANVDSRSQHLLEFALMGTIFFKLIKRKENPTVAILNVGEESSKGTEEVKQAYKLIEKSGLNFIGNVEGRDILKAKADIVVCDGFVGNSILKFGESVPSYLKSKLKQFASKNILNKILVGIALYPLKNALKDMNPNKEGGVPILGVKGVAIIGHGSSSSEGIKNMIIRAAEMSDRQINKHIETALTQTNQ